MTTRLTTSLCTQDLCNLDLLTSRRGAQSLRVFEYQPDSSCLPCPSLTVSLQGLSGHIVVCLCSSAASPPASYAWLEHLLVPLRRLINSPVVVLGHNRGES